jgi:nitrite reductase/ring-hydroxylating ferredoxin subunit
MTSPTPLAFPAALRAPGTAEAEFEVVATLDMLPEGSMLRISRGDLDVLLVHTAEGVAAIEDRCPHMSAPFSVGRLDGCELHCPLHRGTFDLRSGEVLTFPTTGGLDADGGSHRPWSPEGSEAKPLPSDVKAQARALTRVRRLRYFPVRVREGHIEAALPR